MKKDGFENDRFGIKTTDLIKNKKNFLIKIKLRKNYLKL